MLFTDPSFLFLFLPTVLTGMALLGWLKAPRAAAAWLVLCSLVFYKLGSPTRMLALLVVSVAFNYGIGRRLAARPSRAWLWLGVGVDLLVLGWFKYANFFSAELIALGVHLPALNILLPVGISFFTFTQIAFLVDAHRGEAKPRNGLHYLLFVTFFPHLVAGPILHHGEIKPQLARPGAFQLKLANITLGLNWFIAGFFKKAVLADSIAVHSNPVFDLATHGAAIGTTQAWLGALGYTLQLYFDFSGYSDMAIGLAYMLGITFPLNFASPYKAASLIEFWRRWHMTLSRFLRDYVYIPLGGNRAGPVRRLVNLFVTMLLGGLWHGAAWTFVIWGALHGVALLVNHLWRSLAARLGVRLPTVLGQAATLLVVILAWVAFRANTLGAATAIWSAMVTPRAGVGPVDWMGWVWVAGLSAIALLAPNTAQIFGRTPWSDSHRVRPGLAMAVVMGLCFGLAVSASVGHPTSFLYFRF